MVNEHRSVISQDSLDIGVTICIALCVELVKLGVYRAIAGTCSWAVTVESPSLGRSSSHEMANEFINLISKETLEIRVTICIALGVGLV
jgi:hypothetical protein